MLYQLTLLVTLALLTGCSVQKMVDGTSDRLMHIGLTHYLPSALRGAADGLEKTEMPQRHAAKIAEVAREIRQVAEKAESPFGRCPFCGGNGKYRDRESGAVVCENGHTYHLNAEAKEEEDRPIDQKEANQRVKFLLICNEACPPCPGWKKRTSEGLVALGYKLTDEKDWIGAYKNGSHGACVLHSSDEWDGSYPRVQFYVDRMLHCTHGPMTANQIHQHYMELYQKCERERLSK